MSNTIIAAYWMIGAMFSFSLMAVGGRELGGFLDTFEIMTYRSLVGVLIVLFFVCSVFQITKSLHYPSTSSFGHRTKFKKVLLTNNI